ncbi:E3 ubiquitin-protein ligase DCST1-like [Ptychodera flava]|uniref:E3 ubiquitin-protein ligase DCST1-like n=1 Tax=Ptychodera flava TaxID=63121 RepID=UPI00396A6EE8
MTIAMLLGGPVTNIFTNARELSRSISCTASLTYNKSKLLYELMHQPFSDVLKDIQSQSKDMQEISGKLKEEFVKIEEEVEKDDEGMQRETKKKENPEDNYRDKLDYRCKDVFNAGVVHCKDKFKEAERKCHQAIKVPGVKDLLCAPMKLTILCKIVQGFDSLCDTDEAVNPGFGDTYKESDQAVEEFDKNFQVEMGWQVVQRTEKVDIRTAEDIRLAVENEFETRKRWLVTVATIIKSFVAFNFVLMFFSAHSYNKHYTGEITFDNVYMTSYFRRIEDRRKDQNKRTLMPLKKAERSELIVPTKFALIAVEKTKLMRGTLIVFLNILISIIVSIFDYLLYHILDIVSRHSQVTITLQGTHAIRLRIYGDGAVAHLFRTMLSGFNSEHSIDSVSTNTACLPYPSHLPSSTLYIIFGCWFVVWFLLYLEAYGLRLRRVICAYFYPKREKKRILFLYNDYLKKRIGFLKHMQKEVRRLAREENLEADHSILTSLRYSFPKLCCCLALLGLGKKRCLICKEREDANTHHCESENCNMAYCRECWEDIQVGL